jgi:hypothetical protein
MNYLKIVKMKTLKVLKYVGIGILGTAFCIGVIFGLQALWNWLIPELFHGPTLTFWQTVGIFFLSKILLTGVAPGSQHSNKYSKDWRKKYQEKCKQASATDQTIVADQA